MTAPAYVAITDAQIAPEKPFTSSLAHQFRDNMLAVIGGGLNAPTMGPGLLSIGGSTADGDLTNGWAPTDPGFYDFNSQAPSVLSSTRTLPWFTYLRVLGDLTISATQTVDKLPIVLASHLPASAFPLFGMVAGDPGVDVDSGAAVGSGGGGGAHHAAGGSNGLGGGNAAAGGTARSLSALNRWWLSKTLPVGGRGGKDQAGNVSAQAGGCLILSVAGNLLMTGGTLTAPAANSSNAAGGSAGGTIIVLCTGTVTDGTFLAVGGNGGGSSNGGGGGSGGAVVVAANAYAGSQTLTATKGNGGGASGNDGGAGYTSKVTISAELLRGLFWR